jgi:hypothetical protein
LQSTVAAEQVDVFISRRLVFDPGDVGRHLETADTLV